MIYLTHTQGNRLCLFSLYNGPGHPCPLQGKESVKFYISFLQHHKDIGWHAGAASTLAALVFWEGFVIGAVSLSLAGAEQSPGQTRH